MKKNNQRLISILGGVSLLTAASAAIATENGAPTTAMGVYDFGAGFMPPATPSGTLGFRAAYYSSDTLKGAHGKDAPMDFSLDVLSLTLAYVRMTEHEVLGAKYGFNVIVPVFKMDNSISVPTPVGTFSDSADVFNIADIQVTPLILQWNLAPNLAMNTQFQIQIPTGDYDGNRLISPGLNHWAFSPIYNVSYITETGLELSSSFELDFSTRNTDTDYKNGIEYRHEFAVGQHSGPWTFGVGGYYYRQLTDDDGPSLTDGNRAEVTALGPALSYFKPGAPVISLHAYKEFNASNRAEGYNLAFRIAKSF